MIIFYLLSAIIGYFVGKKIIPFKMKNYHGPNSNIIRKNIYKIDDKYYKFIPELCVCPLKDCVQYELKKNI